MKTYSVVPNKDAAGWYVKIENVAPTDLYDNKEIAVEKAEELARKNKPSKLFIHDKHHEVEDEKSFK
ncbi:DUF2188 domain-containing protein [Bacillus taeanensis]|uniref:DUF2188 domain-containing protein n=1 Tax=Bacillus taeanensis TaxID=273032 RepID=A0A366XWF0_9BACI|nr:DUF2188 domain-containing protein [Bacillus taeanensis]RBW69099.1 hypothetical protein DS031_13145 [Bacillus taeanensis]